MYLVVRRRSLGRELLSGVCVWGFARSSMVPSPVVVCVDVEKLDSDFELTARSQLHKAEARPRGKVPELNGVAPCIELTTTLGQHVQDLAAGSS